MILYVKENSKIYGSNDLLTPEQEEKEIQKGFAVRYDGEFSWDMGEEKEGCTKEFYLEKDGSIRIEYVEVEPVEPEPTPEPTGNTATWDDMAAAINEGVNEV